MSKEEIIFVVKGVQVPEELYWKIQDASNVPKLKASKHD